MSDYITDIYTNKIFHWVMFLKHNNLGFLRLDSLNIPPHKVEQDDTEESLEAYYEINDQIIEEFGIDETFTDRQKKKEDIAMLKLDFIISGNKMKRTQWRLKELEMETPDEHSKGQNELSKEIAIVSRNIGTGIIDIKDYSIFQYLTAKKQ